MGEALEDFTGGVSEQIDLVDLGLVDKPEERTAFFARLQKEVDRKSLLAASIPVSCKDGRTSFLPLDRVLFFFFD